MLPYLFTYKLSYFLQKIRLETAKKISMKGVQLIAESLSDFFLSHVNGKKEMSYKFCARLVAKTELLQHNKDKSKLLVIELL